MSRLKLELTFNEGPNPHL